MHDLDSGLDLASQPRAGDPPIGEERGACSARTVGLPATAFEAELTAWLAWLEAAQGARADEHAMRRLVRVYGSGWIAITVTGLAIPLLGLTAAALTIVLFAGMLILGYLVTVPGPSELDPTSGSVVAWPEWSSLGPAERARLVRIMNLSRVAARPPGARLLVSELDEALETEPLANCPPLRDLRTIMRADWSGLIPFGSDTLPAGWEPIR